MISENRKEEISEFIDEIFAKFSPSECIAISACVFGHIVAYANMLNFELADDATKEFKKLVDKYLSRENNENP